MRSWRDEASELPKRERDGSSRVWAVPDSDSQADYTGPGEDRAITVHGLSELSTRSQRLRRNGVPFSTLFGLQALLGAERFVE